MKDAPLVLPAQTFLQDSTPRRVRIRASEALKLNETAQVRAFVRAGLQLRIFRLAAGEGVPRAWASFEVPQDSDWCDVYLSNLFPYARDPNAGAVYLPLPTFTDLSWLTPAGETLSPGHYLFVFEQGGSTEEVIRLRRRAGETYFRNSLKVEIEQSGQFSPAQVDAVEAELNARRDKLEPQIRRNSATITCYRPKVVTAQSRDEPRMELVADCDERPDAAAH